jgi:hypothetical protein
MINGNDNNDDKFKLSVITKKDMIQIAIIQFLCQMALPLLLSIILGISQHGRY